MRTTSVTVAYGDGIGPEIMEASLRILTAAGADLDIDEVTVGEKVYFSGNSAGITDEFWESIRRTKVFYKAPLTTPQGGGYKSINVTTRKTLALYANVRPTRSLHPFVATKHPSQDLVIIRENEEDLYAGIEHRQTDEVVQCLKLMSRPGSERIIRYAFEYAKANNRKKVTCFTKDNIMKLTDGLISGMEMVRPGNTVGDIGWAIQTYVEKRGCSVVREFVGHGVGLDFHEAPQVPHYGRRGDGVMLVPGMVFTIEPMINLGRKEIRILKDNWTAVTSDGSLSAQFEQTLVVTDNGFESLTPFEFS